MWYTPPGHIIRRIHVAESRPGGGGGGGGGRGGGGGGGGVGAGGGGGLSYGRRNVDAPYYMACLGIPHFFTSSHKRHDFLGGGGGGITEHAMCFDFLSDFLLKHFSFEEYFSDRLS
jgi:hypothetical protein